MVSWTDVGVGVLLVAILLAVNIYLLHVHTPTRVWLWQIEEVRELREDLHGQQTTEGAVF